MRPTISALLCALFATFTFAASCDADDYMLERTQRNMARLHAYRGTFVERGVLPTEEMRSEVMWKSPDKFLARVLSPDSYAGVTLAYAGSSILIYYPAAGYAIRWENLPAPSPDDARQLIADAYRHNIKTNVYVIGAPGRVAGQPVVGLEWAAKRRGAFSQSGASKVVDKFSFPVEGHVDFQSGARYSYRFDQLELNAELSDELFRVELPKNVIVSRWDMNAPGLNEGEMREQANFEVAMPKQPPAGLVRERIIREAGPVPAFTVIYRHGPHFLFHTMYRDTGLRPTAVEHGVPIDSPAHIKHGHLLVGPTLQYYGFTHKGTRHILLGNIPLEDLVEVADEIP